MKLKIYYIFFFLTQSGCASVFGESSQRITVATEDRDSKTIKNAYCILKNEKGSREINTLNFFVIERFSQDLDIVCKKNGHTDGIAKAISRVKNSMVANFMFLEGLIGAIVDHNKGAGYEYLHAINVVMGKATVVQYT